MRVSTCIQSLFAIQTAPIVLIPEILLTCMVEILKRQFIKRDTIAIASPPIKHTPAILANEDSIFLTRICGKLKIHNCHERLFAV
jgi:hypothetical protein